MPRGWISSPRARGETYREHFGGSSRRSSPRASSMKESAYSALPVSPERRNPDFLIKFSFGRREPRRPIPAAARLRRLGIVREDGHHRRGDSGTRRQGAAAGQGSVVEVRGDRDHRCRLREEPPQRGHESHPRPEALRERQHPPRIDSPARDGGRRIGPRLPEGGAPRRPGPPPRAPAVARRRLSESDLTGHARVALRLGAELGMLFQQVSKGICDCLPPAGEIRSRMRVESPGNREP